ncbi:aldehyde dehydrogenase family protein [Telmatocola sphagniphila]|uniref:Aldehyde dehydrogenase family protein n=1 Tax=Telmatocola sphagniphila TaxID=1123043 RepID=A0A8E6B556_9BACT|nr:aldehyde dehydrogenase family protein [Telmatocola sphagniphila]QVL32128.1 aldehyde dehydrogenase family protein [Telmatocola sphagniphila]
MKFQPVAFLEETRRARVALSEFSGPSLLPIRKLRALLVEKKAEICESVRQDIGRAPAEVLASDLLPFADACRFLERRARAILRPRAVPSSEMPVWAIGARDVIYRKPWGVVGIIGTWNYPILLNGVQILQAMRAGNAVLWKPSELTPKFSNVLKELFDAAGFPRELFQILPATREAGPQLLEADIDHLVFTGSDTVGRKIALSCAGRLLPSTLELSGCDAMIILPDADLEMAARAAWYGITLNQGQTCVALRRIFLLQNQLSEFSDLLKKTATDRKVRPLVTSGQLKQARAIMEEAVANGAKELFADAPANSEDLPGMPATFLTDVRPSMRLCQEAIFAPLAGILTYTDLSDLRSQLNNCPFALGSSIFSRDVTAANQLALQLAPGLVVINDAINPTAHPASPFGGRNSSGWGTTQGAEGLLAMTVPQVVSIRKGKFRPHYDAANGGVNAGTERMLHGILNWKHAPSFGLRIRGIWNMIRGMMQSTKKDHT